MNYFKSLNSFKFTTRNLVFLAMFLAIEIVLSRFLSISAWNIKIGFSFVPIAIVAMIYGMVPAAIVAGLGDFLGAILFPIGPYFPGFTLTAVLTGLIFGIFFHKKRTIVRILIAVLLNQFVIGLLLNTLFISILYGSPYLPLMATRVIQSIVLTIIQVVVIKALDPILSRILRNTAFYEA